MDNYTYEINETVKAALGFPEEWPLGDVVGFHPLAISLTEIDSRYTVLVHNGRVDDTYASYVMGEHRELMSAIFQVADIMIENGFHRTLQRKMSYVYIAVGDLPFSAEIHPPAPGNPEWIMSIGCQTWALEEWLQDHAKIAVENGLSYQQGREIARALYPILSLVVPEELYESFEEMMHFYDNETGTWRDSEIRLDVNEILASEFPESCSLEPRRYGPDYDVLAISYTCRPGTYGEESITVANYLALVDSFGESVDTRSYAYAIDANFLGESELRELRDILDSLADYPIIDEDRESEIRSEWEDASWPDIAREIDFRLLFLPENPDPLPDHWMVENVLERLSYFLRKELDYDWRETQYSFEWCEHMDGGAWLYDLHRLNGQIENMVNKLVKHTFSLRSHPYEIIRSWWVENGYDMDDAWFE